MITLHLPEECRLSEYQIKDTQTNFRFHRKREATKESIDDIWTWVNSPYRCKARAYSECSPNDDELFVAFVGDHSHSLFECDDCDEKFDLALELSRLE